MPKNIKRPIDVVIIPGSRHTSQEYWYPQLANTLRSKGLTVLYPRFPPFPQQTLLDWEETLKPFEDQFTKNTIFIGHSLGGRFLFDYLEKHQAGAAFFISAPYKEEIEIWREQMSSSLEAKALLDQWEQTNGTFFNRPIDWEKLRNNIGKIHLFYSTNDILIPKIHPIEIQRHLSGKIHWIGNGRHLDVPLLRIPGLTATVLKTYDEIHRSNQEGCKKRSPEG